MDDLPEKRLSDYPHTPRISYSQYPLEKAAFAGNIIATILYGITIVLFFQCMGALLNSANRAGERIRWGLMAHTVSIFLAFTIFTMTILVLMSVCYIDGREFSGAGGALVGPWGYFENVIFWKAINIIPNTMLLLNNWLADGILLYRCYVVYFMNYWVIAFPCMMYLASIGMGIAYTYAHPDSNHPKTYVTIRDFGISWFSISLSLNVLLTVMIITRLVLHNWELRKTLGVSLGTAGLYKAVVTMLVESFALYAGTLLLYIATWGPVNYASHIFFPLVGATQVISPFPVIPRVANRQALTRDTITLGGGVGSVRSWSQGGSPADGGALPDGGPVNPTDTDGGLFRTAAPELSLDLDFSSL